MTTVQIPPGRNLDPYFRSLRALGTTFILGAGTYTTQGCFAFSDLDCCGMAPGTSLIGAGRDHTKIILTNPVLEHRGEKTGYTEALMGGAREVGASPILHLEGFTLDLGTPSVPTIGIHLWTSKATVRSVTVKGVFGDREAKSQCKEGFGILVNSSHEALFDGSHDVDDCKVIMSEHPRENYSCGIYVGCVRRDVPLLRSRIRSCSVQGGIGTASHAAFAANDLTTIESCRARKVLRAFFCDTAPVRDVEITNLVAEDIQWAVDLRVAKEGDVRSKFVVRDSHFYFRVPPSGWAQALLASDESGKAPTHIEDLVFESCLFDGTGIAQASKGRTRGARAGAVHALNCVWVGEWQAPITQENAKEWVLR